MFPAKSMVCTAWLLPTRAFENHRMPPLPSQVTCHQAGAPARQSRCPMTLLCLRHVHDRLLMDALFAMCSPRSHVLLAFQVRKSKAITSCARLQVTTVTTTAATVIATIIKSPTPPPHFIIVERWGVFLLVHKSLPALPPAHQLEPISASRR